MSDESEGRKRAFFTYHMNARDAQSVDYGPDILEVAFAIFLARCGF